MKSKAMEKQPKQSLPLTELTAITPLDGRYRKDVSELAPFVSEFGIIKTRVEIEAKYLVALSKVNVIRPFLPEEEKTLENFGQSLTFDQASRVKEIEDGTQHDVKAMELTFRELLSGTTLEDIIPMIHFGLTSEDVNNLTYRLMTKRATEQVALPVLDGFVDNLMETAGTYKNTPMLGRTHGQPAEPTTYGKELINFAVRLNTQILKLKQIEMTGKLDGAVGNYSTFKAAYPEVNWIKFSEDFVRSLGLEPNIYTTQINPYEDFIEYFQTYQRINNIVIDFDQDMWRYISDNWLVQKVKEGEVGSSVMTHKVNPIKLENSEGNLGISNAIINFFTEKLSKSRLQRDLSDSTVIRNLGVVIGHSLLSYKNAVSGLNRTRPNEQLMLDALTSDWVILGGPTQTILRRDSLQDAYAMLASKTRGKHMDKGQWYKLVDDLPITENQKTEIKKITPQSYIGEAVKLVELGIEEIKNSRK